MRFALSFALALLPIASLADTEQDSPLLRPSISGHFGSISKRLTDDYDVVLRPDTIEPEWWAGAPSVLRDSDGTFWLACRMRTGEGERGLRGYELRMLKSADGVSFEPVLRIPREAVPIPGFERPALLRDPKSGLYKLYACGPWKDGPWGIVKFDDAASPEKFDPSSAHLVVGPREKSFERDIPPREYKDPVVLYAEGAYHCYVIGYVRQNERIFHFASPDGERWEPVGSPYQPVMDLAGWHDFFIRPSCVVPIDAGYLFVYEGSSTTWHDPVYNVCTGLGFTFDLHTVIDLTPDSPLAVSSTPAEKFATFRYSSWVPVDGEFWVYAEVVNSDLTHEIRRFRLNIE